MVAQAGSCTRISRMPSLRDFGKRFQTFLKHTNVFQWRPG